MNIFERHTNFPSFGLLNIVRLENLAIQSHIERQQVSAIDVF